MTQPAATSPITLHPLALGDAGYIIHRHGALIAPEFGWNMEFEATIAEILANFMLKFNPADEASWIAKRDREIMGSLFLIRQNATTAKLRVLYVEPAARCMGLATRLLETSFQFAREKGYQTVSLFTTNSNVAARRIYQKLGMKLVSEEPEFFAGQHQIGEIWEIALPSPQQTIEAP
jgi:GNAT superfamily N-acetyltransferase